MKNSNSSFKIMAPMIALAIFTISILYGCNDTKKVTTGNGSTTNMSNLKNAPVADTLCPNPPCKGVVVTKPPTGEATKH